MADFHIFSIILIYDRLVIMRTAIICLIAVFLLNLVGMYFNWYEFFWFDMVLHYLGGFFIALLFYHYLRPHFLPNVKLHNFLVLVGAVMFIGVVWEFFEYILNQTAREAAQAAFGLRVDFMGDMNDTMTDLLMDMLGGFTIAGLHLGRSRKRHS